MSNPVKITIYRWAGQKWFLHIRSECVECDLSVAQARSLLSAHPDWPVELEVKPWLTFLWESLRRGGWHAPVVLVDGRVLCQGTVPSRAGLEGALKSALMRRGMACAFPGSQDRVSAGERPAEAATGTAQEEATDVSS